MLESLVVRNYALIEQIEIDFAPGLNVLTGETGAGKSILAGALSLLLGAKGDTEAVRTGAKEAVVTGVIRLPEDAELAGWLEERGVEPEDGTILIRRIIKREGRGTSHIQSVPVTRGDLGELAGFLVDMHSQHEHQTLLKVDNQRRLLDEYGGLTAEAAELYRLFGELNDLHEKQKSLESDEAEQEREKDYLRFVVREIDGADLKPGEEEELTHELNRLSQHEKLFAALNRVLDRTLEGRGGALALLREAREAMDTVIEIDGSQGSLAGRFDGAFYELEDIGESLREYRGEMEFSPERLEEVEARLQTIHGLEKKYGAASLAALMEHREESERRLADLENINQNREELEEEIRDRQRDLGERAQALSRARRQTAGELEERIQGHLRELGMPQAQFSIALEPRLNSRGKPSSGPYGMDRIEFRISSNRGEPPRSLKSVASGGEISRVMLALKSVFAETDNVGTLVFDEIDTGIGGEVAKAVGHHLRKLAEDKQVLVITHLATIAAHAGTQLKVSKEDRDGRTVTRVFPVEGEQRVEEVARMLSGDGGASVSRSHAQDLLTRHGSPDGV